MYKREKASINFNPECDQLMRVFIVKHWNDEGSKGQRPFFVLYVQELLKGELVIPSVVII